MFYLSSKLSIAPGIFSTIRAKAFTPDFDLME
jgi:hypothetical protein